MDCEVETCGIEFDEAPVTRNFLGEDYHFCSTKCCTKWFQKQYDEWEREENAKAIGGRLTRIRLI